MNNKEMDLVAALTQSVNDLSERVVALEAAINKGRGAFMMFLSLLSIVGTVLGAIKLFGK